LHEVARDTSVCAPFSVIPFLEDLGGHPIEHGGYQLSAVLARLAELIARGSSTKKASASGG